MFLWIYINTLLFLLFLGLMINVSLFLSFPERGWVGKLNPAPWCSFFPSSCEPRAVSRMGTAGVSQAGSGHISLFPLSLSPLSSSLPLSLTFLSMFQEEIITDPSLFFHSSHVGNSVDLATVDDCSCILLLGFYLTVVFFCCKISMT